MRCARCLRYVHWQDETKDECNCGEFNPLTPVEESVVDRVFRYGGNIDDARLCLISYRRKHRNK